MQGVCGPKESVIAVHNGAAIISSYGIFSFGSTVNLCRDGAVARLHTSCFYFLTPTLNAGGTKEGDFLVRGIKAVHCCTWHG